MFKKILFLSVLLSIFSNTIIAGDRLFDQRPNKKRKINKINNNNSGYNNQNNLHSSELSQINYGINNDGINYYDYYGVNNTLDPQFKLYNYYPEQQTNPFYFVDNDNQQKLYNLNPLEQTQFNYNNNNSINGNLNQQDDLTQQTNLKYDNSYFLEQPQNNCHSQLNDSSLNGGILNQFHDNQYNISNNYQPPIVINNITNNNIINNFDNHSENNNTQNNSIGDINYHKKEMEKYLEVQRISEKNQVVDQFTLKKRKREKTDIKNNKNFCKWNLLINYNENLKEKLNDLGWENLTLYIFPVRLNEKNELKYNSYNDLISADDAKKIFQENFYIDQQNNPVKLENNDKINVTVGLSCSRSYNHKNGGKKKLFQDSLPLYIGVVLIYNENQILDCMAVPVEPLLKNMRKNIKQESYKHIDDDILQRISFDDNAILINFTTSSKIKEKFKIYSFANHRIYYKENTTFLIKGNNLKILDKNKFKILSDFYRFEYDIHFSIIASTNDNDTAELNIYLSSIEQLYYEHPITNMILGQIVIDIDNDNQYNFTKDIIIHIDQQ